MARPCTFGQVWCPPYTRLRRMQDRWRANIVDESRTAGTDTHNLLLQLEWWREWGSFMQRNCKCAGDAPNNATSQTSFFFRSITRSRCCCYAEEVSETVFISSTGACLCRQCSEWWTIVWNCNSRRLIQIRFKRQRYPPLIFACLHSRINNYDIFEA